MRMSRNKLLDDEIISKCKSINTPDGIVNNANFTEEHKEFIVRKEMFVKVMQNIYFDKEMNHIVRIAKFVDIYKPIYFTKFVGMSSILLYGR